jgi:hypothetical protein
VASGGSEHLTVLLMQLQVQRLRGRVIEEGNDRAVDAGGKRGDVGGHCEQYKTRRMEKAKSTSSKVLSALS